MVSADNAGMTQIQSFEAIQAWINNINNNLGGAGRSGYKSQRVTFGGSNAVVASTTSTALTPMQQAEVTFTVVQSAGDFSQGQIRASGSDTHFAIKDRPSIVGANFFAVRELLDTKGTNSSLGSDYQYYLTREGEFHWVPGSRSNLGPNDVRVPPVAAQISGYLLVNNYNLAVINRKTGAPVFSETGTFKLVTDLDPTAVDPLTTDLTLADLQPIVVNEPNPQNLTYSRYGSSIFDTATSSFPATSDVSQDQPTFSLQKAERVQASLESSNSSVTQLIPELTLAQKTFTALAKTLTVASEDMDTVFGFIR